MSTLLVCAIMDSKVGAFSPPMHFRSKGEAVRAFLDALKDDNTTLSKHPRDYQLFLIGTFDDLNGALGQDKIEMLMAGEEVPKPTK